MNMLTRRQFVSSLAAGLLWPQKPENMIVRSVRPEDLEMPLSGFLDFITPIDKFFVRTHVAVPKVELADWRLKVEGHVANPMVFSMDALRKMPPVELISVLECSGNGRSFYEPPVPGLQWQNGAVGNGRWRGARLADVLKHAGVKAGAVEVLFDGADVPLGLMEDFQRSIPLKKALDPNTILAYEMNGETLPVKHGYPLRCVVPGWAGNSWIKWVTAIRVLNEPANGFWMKNAYLYPEKPVVSGSAVPPETMRPVTSLRVKSIIGSPRNLNDVEIGKAASVTGAAWSGDAGPVVGVDVSLDAGRTWKPARLTGQATRFGWRLWKYSWIPQDERFYRILARARDASGDAQPVIPEWNPSGYLWNVVPRVEVESVKNVRTGNVIADGVRPPAPESLSGCLVCHGRDVIEQQRLTRQQWNREVTKMINWGAKPILGSDLETLLDYLLKIAGPR